jgi:hypothetical protein
LVSTSLLVIHWWNLRLPDSSLYNSISNTSWPVIVIGDLNVEPQNPAGSYVVGSDRRIETDALLTTWGMHSMADHFRQRSQLRGRRMDLAGHSRWIQTTQRLWSHPHWLSPPFPQLPDQITMVCNRSQGPSGNYLFRLHPTASAVCPQSQCLPNPSSNTSSV